jgi:hypothetical protein
MPREVIWMATINQWQLAPGVSIHEDDGDNWYLNFRDDDGPMPIPLGKRADGALGENVTTERLRRYLDSLDQ